MKIWVDADACPVAVKDILFRAAERRKVNVILVANSYIRLPPSRFLECIKVAAGLDAADHEIVKNLIAGDLVITADIPLAAEVIAKKGLALSPRGELHTPENIASRLSVRDFMHELRASGIDTGGPQPMSKSDIRNFANQLDRELARSGE